MSRWLIISVASLGLAGCVSMPSHPTIMALPGKSRTYDEFRQAQVYCQTMAQQQQAESPESLQAKSTAKSALVTGMIGAAGGAIIGAVTGSPATGAAIGGASGGILGAAGGAGAAQRAATTMHQQYDQNFASCMYAHGHQIPNFPTMSQ